MANRREWIVRVLGLGIFGSAVTDTFGGRWRRRRCYSTPLSHATGTSEKITSQSQFVQPEYSAWNQLKYELTKAEVLALLGKPTTIEDTGKGRWSFWTYGQLEFESDAIPWPYKFVIRFDRDELADWYDPFSRKLSENGVPTTKLSENGEPTTPAPLLPYKGTSFHHYPRLVDLRWNPSSGVYPMRYRIQFDLGRLEVTAKEEYHFELNSERIYESQIPYLSVQLAGNTSVRWRVQAVNRAGESSWSEYSYFEFDNLVI